MNTPALQTERLILRKFVESDVKALHQIHSDEEVNKFLPWFPLKTLEEARVFYKKHYEDKYDQGCSCHYAICLKEDNCPIGYINVETDGSHDLGYGLAKEFWNKGIVTEAGMAVIEQLKKYGLPFITATHDVNNPGSGRVMQRLGMQYQYSYEEQWQPKDFLVVFRMYQLNLDGNDSRIYKEYWDNSKVHYVEVNV